jgi:hypothetical protein
MESGETGCPSVADRPAEGAEVTDGGADGCTKGVVDGCEDPCTNGGVEGNVDVATGGCSGCAAPAKPEQLPLNGSGPPGDGGPLGISTVGTIGDLSATSGGWPESTFSRVSDTYNPYPTAASTARIIKFFSAFIFVLLDESDRPWGCG